METGEIGMLGALAVPLVEEEPKEEHVCATTQLQQTVVQPALETTLTRKVATIKLVLLQVSLSHNFFSFQLK